MKLGPLLFGAILCIAPHSAHAQTAQEAPLGLSWGMSTSQAREQGVDLKEFPSSDFGKSYVATKVDKSVADQGATLLSFGFNDRLWRIVVTSRDFNNDPSGAAVLARYQELMSVLSEKYGKPSSAHRLGDSIYSQSSYFLAGIRGGQSVWFSNFETPQVSLQLGLTASDSSTGGWRLIYENKNMRKDFEASRRSKEKGSL